MSESGGSDAGVDTSSVSDSLYSRTGPADIHISSHDEGEQDETVIEASEEEDEDEDEDEEESSESGSNQDGRASGSEAGYTDLDDDLFNEVDFDTGFEDPDDFGPFYDSDFDAEAWLRQREHLHHHYHHHHHHGHGFPGLDSDHAQYAEDEGEEDSLFVDDHDHDHDQHHADNRHYFDEDDFLGQHDLDAFDILSSFATGNSPHPPGHSHNSTPLREILEAAAVFGAESLFRDPREGSIRDQLIQFHQNNVHLHNIATQNNRTTAANMDRSNRDRDELVRMEIGGSGGGNSSNRASRSRRSQQPSQGPSVPAEVIDLTLDDTDPPQPMLPFPRPAAPVRPPRTNTRRSAQRSVPPPNLTRSDTRYVNDDPNVINLVSDSEDEASATGPTVNAGTRPPGSRRHNPPRAAASRPAPVEPRAWGLPNMHSLFAPVFGTFMSRRTHQHRPPDASEDIAFMGQRNLHPHPHPMHRHGFGALNGLNIPGFGTIDLNYTATPFHNRHGPPATPKPKHEPPKAAREGFTRDTGEEVVAMCPSCEEELAYDPDGDDAADASGPPAKKARTRRDKAEHHFFAVKGCGHVYCRKCYEGRGQSTRGPHYTGFDRPLSSDGRLGKKTYCAVEGCGEEVGNKSAWVGIFL